MDFVPFTKHFCFAKEHRHKNGRICSSSFDCDKRILLKGQQLASLGLHRCDKAAAEEAAAAADMTEGWV